MAAPGTHLGRHTAGSARQAANSPWLDRLARVGLASRGLVFILIGVLAVQLAFGGGSSEEASQQGAFSTLAQNGFGKALLWLVVVGFLAFALWQVTDAVWGHREEDSDAKRWAYKIAAAAQAIAYAALGLAAARTAMGGGGGGGQSGQSATARLLDRTGGQTLVAVVGVGIIALAAVLTWRGLKTKFEERLDLSSLSASAKKAVLRLGMAGYVARGVVFALIGIFVVSAAVSYDPEKARGLDAALRELADQPFGTWLLLLVALGLACYGAYSFVEARYRRL